MIRPFNSNAQDFAGTMGVTPKEIAEVLNAVMESAPRDNAAFFDRLVKETADINVLLAIAFDFGRFQAQKEARLIAAFSAIIPQMTGAVQ